jgi:hypothetical protein
MKPYRRHDDINRVAEVLTLAVVALVLIIWICA